MTDMQLNALRCGLSVRRYNLKAIHNGSSSPTKSKHGVVYLCEDTIWKQFTTLIRRPVLRQLVWFICAKIQFESNSQRHPHNPLATLGCGLSVRRYNLKAIHNSCHCEVVQGLGVVYLCEDTIWKQFTTVCVSTFMFLWVWFICAKIQFESNSQHITKKKAPGNWCGLSVRRYNLKAIHNARSSNQTLSWCGLSVRRYNLKAIHNLVDGDHVKWCGVVYLCEDTIWKQFTTRKHTTPTVLPVWFICAKIQFESNSQQSINAFESA